MDCYFFKTVCIGDTGVGKTHFMEIIQQKLRQKNRQVEKMQPIHETIGVQFFSKMFVIDDTKRIKLHFWDLSGQRRFREVIEPYYIYGDAVLLCFDVANLYSFLSCTEWIKELKYALKDEVFRPYIFLMGIHKKKTKRVVTKKDIREFTRKNNTMYLEYDNTIHSAYVICDTIIRTLIHNIHYIANHRKRFVMNIDADEFTDSFHSSESNVLIANDSFSNLQHLRLSYSSSSLSCLSELRSRTIRTIEEEEDRKKEICCIPFC